VSKNNSLVDEMILDINALGLRIVHCILSKLNHALVVPIKHGWSVKGQKEKWHLGKEVMKPNDFL